MPRCAAFVAPLKDIRDPRQKMLSVDRSVGARGMFSLEYAEVTRTASGTFHDRQGNCLSFTMLFVALARAAGLPANYQSVEVPPTWANDGQVVIANHVNTVVRTGSRRRDGRRLQHSRRTRGSPAAAASTTRTRSACSIRTWAPRRCCAATTPRALIYLREAARVRPDIAGRVGQPGRAVRAPSAVTSTRKRPICARSKSTMTSHRRCRISSLVYQALGEPRARGRVSRARARLSRAQSLLSLRVGDARLRAAAVRKRSASLRKALRLKPDEHEFYELRGQV